MKRMVFFIFACSIFFNACSGDSDILAEIDGAVITRGEFREWLNSKGIPFENIMKSKSAYVMNLEQLAVEKLTSKKALEEDFDNDPYFIKLHDIIYRNYTAAYFRDYLAENLDFNEKGYDISIIRLNFNPGDEKSLNDSNFIMTHKILPMLEKGLSFEEAAAKFSQDPSAKQRGRVGFIAGNMHGHNFNKNISGLTPGEYTREPIMEGNSLYLVKVNRVADINRGNMARIITDESNLEDVKKFFLESALDEIEKSVFASSGAESNIPHISYARGGDVIFSVSGEVFTVSDLNDILEIFYELKYGSKPVRVMTKENKILTSRRILSETLQFREALSRGIEDEPQFLRRWDLVKRSTLSGAYKYRRLSADVVVTGEEVLSEYRSNLDKRYYRIQQSRRGNVKVPLPFNDVRDGIRQELFKGAMASLRKRWDADTLSGNSFNIKDRYMPEE